MPDNTVIYHTIIESYHTIYSLPKGSFCHVHGPHRSLWASDTRSCSWNRQEASRSATRNAQGICDSAEFRRTKTFQGTFNYQHHLMFVGSLYDVYMIWRCILVRKACTIRDGLTICGTPVLSSPPFCRSSIAKPNTSDLITHEMNYAAEASDSHILWGSKQTNNAYFYLLWGRKHMKDFSKVYDYSLC